jgi:peptidoglycan/LPS O-acetylase OafA/YrhL
MTASSGAPPGDSSKYRPDIDGLRALAVLPVILFHADLGCPGGFVGVDIFFVISGFLITSLILREINHDAFHLITFWERRIRRILPALIFVILATLVSGWFLYLPEDFNAIGKSVVAQALLISNVIFWRNTGYFAPGVDTMPLLHTWSLAVEEQFYVLFPLVLVFLARHKRFPVASTILGLGAVSFAISIAGTYVNPSATFFLLPTRAWELMIGGFLAAAPGRQVTSRWVNETAAWAGLGLILFSIFFYTKETRFPGLAAMPPCLGAALIIFSGRTGATLISRGLVVRPVVFIGLISYSLYLWHWPVLVFSKYLARGGQSVELRVALLVASLVLAILCWRYVETPFRQRKIFRTRAQIFSFAGGALGTLLFLGWLVYVHNGFPARFPPEALRYAESRTHHAFRNEISLKQALAGEFVELGSKATDQPVSVLIWGDSHAMSVTPVINDLCRQFFCRGIQATHSATPPVLEYADAQPFSLKEDSQAFNNAVLAYISQNHVKNVILAAAWPGYPESASFKADLVSTVRRLLDLGTKVYLFKEVPFPGFDAPRLAAVTVMRKGDLEELGTTRAQYQQRNHDLNQTFEQIARLGATVLDPSPYFLNHKGVYGVMQNGQILYWDYLHLSVEGSRLLAPLFEPIFQPKEKSLSH